MKNEELEKESYVKIQLEYDPKEYKFEYIKKMHLILLRRLKDDKVVNIFNDDVGFIVQYNLDNNINFIVTDYSKTNANGDKIVKLAHYIDHPNNDMFIKYNEFDCKKSRLIDCRLSRHSFLIENNEGKCIYNLRRKSKPFDEVYNSGNLTNMLPGSMLLVTETRKIPGYPDIKDTITYGINPEILEVTTPYIWSKLQEKYITVYDEKRFAQLKQQYGPRIPKGTTRGDLTISFEVDRYLKNMAMLENDEHNVYLHNGNINDTFVNQLVKK